MEAGGDQSKITKPLSSPDLLKKGLKQQILEVVGSVLKKKEIDPNDSQALLAEHERRSFDGGFYGRENAAREAERQRQRKQG